MRHSLRSSLIVPSFVVLGLARSGAAMAVCYADDGINGVVAAPCEYLPDAIAETGSTCGKCNDQTCIDDEDVWVAGVHPVATRLHKVTLTDPDATCNDGSQAIMYVRRATVPADEDKWVIVLEGGGSAFRAQDGDLAHGMWDRWTGDDGDLLSWPAKTSTDGTASAVFVGGILSVGSAFATWNWVYLNYCSSDLWTGTQSGVELSPLPERGYGVWKEGGVRHEGFKADFNGHNIVDAALDALTAAPVTYSYGVNTWTMPVLDDPLVGGTVLMVGDSAGSQGVMHNLDHVSSRLTSMSVYGGLGSNLKPPIGVYNELWYVDAAAPLGVEDVQAGLDHQWAQVAQVNGFVDQSCELALGDGRCMHLHELEIGGHLATSHLVQTDVMDSQLRETYMRENTGGFRAGALVSHADVAAAGWPVFGPQYGSHAVLGDGRYFSDVLRLCEPGPIQHDVMSYQTALARFVILGAPVDAWEGLYDPALGATWMSVTVCP